MEKQTGFATFIESQNFDKARELLQHQLESGEMLDPRTDRYWAPLADQISQAMRAASGIDATIPFWETLRDFFISSIEPTWGHSHKGHIFFRLGFSVVRRDFARAKREFEAAYQDDLTLEAKKGGTQDEIAQRSQTYSAYVALAILERIEDSDFAGLAEKKHFVDQLFGPSFDAAIMGEAVRPELIQEALAAIAPAQALAVCSALYIELQKASSLAMPVATVSLTGSVLESLLLADLYYRKGITSLSGGNDILCVELGPLLQEANRQSTFPTRPVRAACELVHFFRNRLHPGNEIRQKYKLVPRVATTLKVLFELALLEWRKAFP